MPVDHDGDAGWLVPPPSGGAMNKKMNEKSKLRLIAHLAALAMAAACSGLPSAAAASSAPCAHAALPHLANPKKTDDDSDDAGDTSGDATPVPEPQPVR